MIEAYPTLSALVGQLDAYLNTRHPEFFGPSAHHPFSTLKPYKVIHDQLWGTNRFSWLELALIDTPVLQRLRNIHQTGLAYYVYPSARHSRFEHCLGVVTIASRIFDSLVQRFSGDLQTIARVVDDKRDATAMLARLRQELRLAALLHDVGHSLYSHASERVYSSLRVLQDASGELTSFVGKEKGAGEVISFCLARTDAVRGVLDRAKAKLGDQSHSGEFVGPIDLENVALLIVGRSKHPFLQFMGDIISSGFDADKLDYLLRDATSAGLPLRYDLERYLYTVYIEKDELSDDEGELDKLYRSLGTKVEKRPATPPKIRFPYFDTYRLRLPKQAMSTIEQIVICKLMLYSYIYHHPKVRSAEGLLAKLLERVVSSARSKGKSDEEILEEFLAMEDPDLNGPELLLNTDKRISECSYRLVNRLLPREIYRFTSAVSHAEGALMKNFFSSLEDKARRKALITDLEEEIGRQLLSRDKTLGATASDALWTAGTWLDVPNVPKFEDMRVLVGGTKDVPGVPIADIFPIAQWVQAYEAHRFYVRIFAFSEYSELCARASRDAFQKIVGIKSDEFYNSCRRTRQS